MLWSNEVADMTAPRVSIIILNYNGRNWLNECLSTILNQNINEPFEVILVDNGSTDNSVEYVRTNFPQVKIIELDKNYGFAEGNNIGIEHAKGRYLLFVNMDTKAENEWLRNLIRAADNHQEYQVLCSIQLPSQGKNRIKTLNAFLGVTTSPYESSEAGTDSLFASGACFLIRKEWLNELGYLFDPHYFCFGEDVELSLRTILMGGRICYVGDSRIHHYVGGSEYAPFWASSLAMRNNLLTLYKLFSSENFIRIVIAKVFYLLLRLIFRPQQFKKTLGMMKGLLTFFLHFHYYKDYRKNFKKLKTKDDKYVLQRLLYKRRIEKIVLKKVLYRC